MSKNLPIFVRVVADLRFIEMKIKKPQKSSFIENYLAGKKRYRELLRRRADKRINIKKEKNGW